MEKQLKARKQRLFFFRFCVFVFLSLDTLFVVL